MIRGARPARMIAAAGVSALLGAALLAGCATEAPARPAASAPASAPASPAPSPSPTPAPVGIAATAGGASVAVHSAPEGELVDTLASPISSGAPLTFLLVEDRGDWLRVALAQRPNGSMGWIRASEVSLARLEYSLVVSTAENTLSVYRNDELVEAYPAATGTGGTPTPLGSFYLTELLEPTNAGYGPFAFGLSAFSDVLTSFGGGPGQIGLHGTEDTASIGTAVSHGCIRLSNEVITALAQVLPLGTPITIE
ncbi:lipoprotein-anchoring transpeptidase ErfK/SrfK [Marisediminicola sp. UYEF4]|uniref:L,D-transpeptidase n=1 Tax=Marisediminicola sp. UYEF4 TaxID=1756384 RepID=UPI00339A1E4E